jgi:hypothetical protein
MSTGGLFLASAEAADRGKFIEHDEVGKLMRAPVSRLMRIRWTEPAARDLTRVCDYIERHADPATARGVPRNLSRGFSPSRVAAAFGERQASSNSCC